jgi:hypothetical protein
VKKARKERIVPGTQDDKLIKKRSKKGQSKIKSKEKMGSGKN